MSSILKPLVFSAFLSMHDLVIIYEAGKLELRRKGWAESIEEIWEANSHLMVITVRTDFIGAIIEKFGFENPLIYSVSDSNILQISKKIIEICRQKKTLQE